MNPRVVAFAGSIGSGKSTVSVALAQHVGWPRASFGEFVRAEARARGLDTTREVLQDLGAKLSVERGWERFCADTLAFAGWARGQPAVVDGVRHVEALDALVGIVAPSPLDLVFLGTEETVRRQRLLAKGIATPQEQHRIENHSTEIQVESVLARRAALTLDGARPVPDLVAEIVAALGLGGP